MRSCRVPVMFVGAVAAGLAGVGSASAAGVTPSAGHAVVKADGGGNGELQDPYEDTGDMVGIYRTHRLTD